MGIVTVSAAYGAAGAEIAPAVAQLLGLPFHDRAIAAQVAGRLGVSVPEAEANDRTREAYVRHFYRCDPSAARHYHLVIDSTALPVETVVDLVVTAARARGIGLR